MGKKISPHMDVAPGKGGGIITPLCFPPTNLSFNFKPFTHPSSPCSTFRTLQVLKNSHILDLF